MMTPVINALTPSTEWVDTIAMLGFSFAGILAARGRGVDPVGVFILAFTSAFGGVTVRDMLLDIRPFYWVSHEAFTWLIICFTIFAPVIAARLSDRIARELFLWADAVGLGFFSASATVLAWESGIPPLSCTLVGVITGIVGGIFRDVLLNRLPAALSDRKPYGLLVRDRAPFGRRCRSNRHFGDRRFNRVDPYVHTEGELGNSIPLSALTPHIPWERTYQSDPHPSAF